MCASLPAHPYNNSPRKTAGLTVARAPRLEFLKASNSSVILEAKAWRYPRASFSSLTLEIQMHTDKGQKKKKVIQTEKLQ